MADKSGKLDKFLSKVLSRKLLVFIISTIFLALAMLTPEQWISVAVAYIGVEGFADMIIRYNTTKLYKPNKEDKTQPEP